MNIKINLPEKNNIAEFRAKLIMESIKKQVVSSKKKNLILGMGTFGFYFVINFVENRNVFYIKKRSSCSTRTNKKSMNILM